MWPITTTTTTKCEMTDRLRNLYFGNKMKYSFVNTALQLSQFCHGPTQSK